MRAGSPVDLSAGARCGRGFADLGYEEFLILPPRKLLSLFTGQISELNPEHEKFFFAIPSPDQMVAELDRRGIDIVGLTFERQRTWVLTTRKEGGPENVDRATHIEEVLALALIRCF
jgi:hypothetical protein